MPDLTISISDDTKTILTKRAKKNLFTLREQIEDIVRQSAIRTKATKSSSTPKVDDKLVSIFSREIRGKPRKKK